MACLLVAALILQLRARRYVPWIYWLTVVLVSIVGTQITDLLTDKLEISLYVSTVVFACALAATFAIWFVGDLLSQSRNYGGVGLGTVQTSLAFLTVIIALVAWVTFEGDRAEEPDPAQ
ncbi:MAG: hypothetical protein JWP25_6799 [Bradyrhizobium sp.]|nr:hypothetical protein [Bradyrhizobium sp.]